MKVVEEEEEEEINLDVTALKVMHNFNNFKEGSTAIFTLADLDITDNSENLDILVNEEITEKEKYQKYDEIKKGKKFNKYSDEKQDLLPQYSEEKGPSSFMISEGKAIVDEEEKKSMEEKLEKDKKILSHLNNLEGSTFLNPAQDFYSKDEMMSFKTPKKKKKKSSKVSKKQSQKLIESISGQETDTKGDLGTKVDRENRQKELHFEEVVNTLDRRQKYNMALQKVSEDSKYLMNEEEEHEDELFHALQKARDLAKKSNEEEIFERTVKRKREEEDEKEKEGLVYSSKTEFVNNFTSSLEDEDDDIRKRKKRRTNKTITENKEVVKEEEKVVKEEGKGDEMEKEETNTKEEETENNDDENLEESEKEERHTILGGEPEINKGLSTTLTYLKRKGGVETMDVESRSGRVNDKLIEVNDGDNSVRLDYLDEYGKKMTQKEAFRRLSYRFHGKEPGKNKQEKKIKKVGEEKRRKNMSEDDTPLMSVSAMKKTLQKTGQPFVFMDGNIAKIKEQRKRVMFELDKKPQNKQTSKQTEKEKE